MWDAISERAVDRRGSIVIGQDAPPELNHPAAATGEHGDLLDLIGHRIVTGTLGPALDEAHAFLALPVPERWSPGADRAHPPAA